MTKEEFEKGYCERSHITLECYRKHLVSLPCACNFAFCGGWAAVHDRPDSIADHMRFYAPKPQECKQGAVRP